MFSGIHIHNKKLVITKHETSYIIFVPYRVKTVEIFLTPFAYGR